MAFAQTPPILGGVINGFRKVVEGMTSNITGLLQRQQQTYFPRGAEAQKKSSTRGGASMGTAASSNSRTNSPNLEHQRRSSLTSLRSPRPNHDPQGRSLDDNRHNFRYGNQKTIPPLQKQGSVKTRPLPPGMGPGMGSAASSFRTTAIPSNNNTPLQNRRGPLKADHSIDVNNNIRTRLGSATLQKKKDVLSPLSRRKSSSMSDLNRQQDDEYSYRKLNIGSTKNSLREGEDKTSRRLKTDALLESMRRKTERLSLSKAKDYVSTNDLRSSNRHAFVSDNESDTRYSRRTSVDDGYSSKRASSDLSRLARSDRKDRKSLDSAYDSGSSDSASPKTLRGVRLHVLKAICISP